MSFVSTTAYTRSHTSTFASDNMRNVLRDIIRDHGLDPTALMDSFERVLGRAIRTWMETGHLQKITIEFYRPGTGKLDTRWDFPIRYDGNGSDDMWVDWDHLHSSMAKAQPPSRDCRYEVILSTKPGRPDVDGMASCQFRPTDGLVARETGTVIATPDIMASATYWRAA